MAEAALVELLSQIILYKGEKKKEKSSVFAWNTIECFAFFYFFPSKAQPSDVKVQAAAFLLSCYKERGGTAPGWGTGAAAPSAALPLLSGDAFKVVQEGPGA